MKNRILCILAISLLLCTSRMAWAEEGKDGPQTAVSLKAWVNEWKRDVPGVGRSVSDNVVVLAGPAVEVEFKNRLVLEGSYLFSASDYKFTDMGTTAQVERRDLDLGLGKQFNRYVGFFVGYRNSSFKDGDAGTKDFSYGIYYSLRGFLPLRGESGFYGNVTWLNTRFKAEGLAREEAPGWISEIGGKSVFTEHVALKVGYKWEVTEGDTSKVKDSFRGTIFELVYAF